MERSLDAPDSVPDDDTGSAVTPTDLPNPDSNNQEVFKPSSDSSSHKQKPRAPPASKPLPKEECKEPTVSEIVSGNSTTGPGGKKVGQLVTTDHKLRRSNKPHTFRCQQCAFRSDTQGKMNEHFRNSHLPVKCPECDDTFTTLNTLSRHCYTHGELTKVCRDCDKKFAFAHELKIHRFSHRRHPAFKCAYPDCDKAFFREGELTKCEQGRSAYWTVMNVS